MPVLRYVAALVVLLLLAGCAQDAAVGKPAASSTTAPPPTVGIDTGSISGNVTDEELLPLSGVAVALAESGATTTTDASGQFTFNDLAPGPYTVIANRVGYEQAGKKATVVAGEVTSVSLLLKGFVIPDEPYHIAIPSSFYITFGWGLFDAFVTWRLSNATCNPCQKMLDFERGPLDVALEPIWTPSTNTPVTNQQVYIWTERNIANGATGSTGENVHSEYKDNRDHHRFTEAELAKLKEFKDFRMNVGGGVLSAMVQQKIDVWFTVGYVGKLPDEYTALPPS